MLDAPSHDERGFANNTRNAKLHLLAKKKRKPAAVRPNSSPARQRAVLLSACLRAAPQHFDSFKVACVEKYLTVIDELPPQYQTAEVVYLSRNSLQSLDGIQQFPNLRVLSASENLLEDIAQLQVLADACPNLQVASFERNPLACLPNYRNKVIQLLPKLQMLDGQGISGQDRDRAGAALKQEAACMAVMLSNACMVHKLARTAELLQLHTELRRALFGSSTVLNKCILPSCIPLDLLKFLRLWDYEGSLAPADRRIITDALTREVVRVHRQLQHAAVQLKGPAQLPALQAWDAAFSQVMLAQQRTIIQLVELVNVLHDDAAKLVASLTRQPADSLAKHAHEQQEAAEQQLVQDREGLILDLRDAALELAGVLASKAQVVLDDGTVISSSPSSASPQHQQHQQQMLQQLQQAQQQQVQQHARSPQRQLLAQISQQLQQGTPVQQQQRRQRQQQQQQQASAQEQMQPANQQLPGTHQQQGTQEHHVLMQQQQQHPEQVPRPQQKGQLLLQEQQLPAFPPSPQQLPQQPQAGPQQQQQQQQQQETSAVVPVKAPARRLSGSGSLRLRPSRSSLAGPQTPSAAAALSTDRRDSNESSNRNLRMSGAERPAAAGEGGPGIGFQQQQRLAAQQLLQQQLLHQQQGNTSMPVGNTAPADHTGSGSPNEAGALSPTAKRLLRNAAATTMQQQQQQWQGQALQQPELVQQEQGQEEDEEQQLMQQAWLQQQQQLQQQQCQLQGQEDVWQQQQQQQHMWPLQEQQLATAHTAQSPTAAPAPVPPSPGTVMPFSVPGMYPAAEAVQGSYVQRPLFGPDASQPGHSTQQCWPQEQQQQQQQQQDWDVPLRQQLSASVPTSPMHQQQQQQPPSMLSRSHSGSLLQLPEDLAHLARNNLVYERIERIAPVGASPPGSPVAATSPSMVVSSTAASAEASVAAAAAANLAAACAAAHGEGGAGDAAVAGAGAGNSGYAHSSPQQLQLQQHCYAPSNAGSDHTESSFYTVHSLVPGSARVSADGGHYQLPGPAAGAAGPLMVQTAATVIQQEEAVGSVDVSAMVKAAQAAARQLFGVEGVPGSCSFFSPCPLDVMLRPQQQQQQQSMLLQQPGSLGDSSAAPGSGAVPFLIAGSDTGATAGDSVAASLGIVDQTGNQSAAGSALDAGVGSSAASASQAATCGDNASYQSGLQEASHLELARGAGSSSPAAVAAAGEELSFAFTSVDGGSVSPSSPVRSRPSSASRPHSPPLHVEKQVREIMGDEAWLVQQRQQQQQQPMGQQQAVQQQQQQLLWSLLSTDDSVEVVPSPSAGDSMSARVLMPQQCTSPVTATAAVPFPPDSPAGQAHAAAVATGPQATPAAAGSASADVAAALSPVEAATMAAVAGVHDTSMRAMRCSSDVGSSVDLSPLRQRLFESVAVSRSADFSGGAGLDGGLVGAVTRQAAAALAAAQSAMEQQPMLLSGAGVPAGLQELQGQLQQQMQQPSASSQQQLWLAQQQQAQQQQQPFLLAQQQQAQQQQQPRHGSLVTAIESGQIQGSSMRVSPRSSGRGATLEDWNVQVLQPPHVTVPEQQQQQQQQTDQPQAQLQQAPLLMPQQQQQQFMQQMVQQQQQDKQQPQAGQLQQQHLSAQRQNQAAWQQVPQQQQPTLSVQASAEPLPQHIQQLPISAGLQMQETQQLPVTDGIETQRTQSQDTCSGCMSPRATQAGTPAAAQLGLQAHAAVAAAVAAAGSGGSQVASAVFAGQVTGPVGSTGVLPTATDLAAVQEAPAYAPAAAMTSLQPAAAAQQQQQRAAVPAAAPLSAQAQHSTAVQTGANPWSQTAAAAAAALSAAPAKAAAAATSANSSSSALASPRKVLAELQGQLVVLAVEKAALEKELELGRGEMDRLQHKALVAEQLQVTVQKMQQDLQAAQQQLQLQGSLANQRAQQNEQLLAQMHQVQEQLAAQEAQQAQQEAEQSQQEAAEAHYRLSLSRRVLNQLHAASKAAALERGQGEAAVQQRQRALQRRVMRGWRWGAAVARKVQVLQLKRRRKQLRAGMAAWMEGVMMQRLAVAQLQAAVIHWATRSCHRVLSHWRYYAYQTRQLGLQLPSPSSSGCSDAERDQQQEPAAAARGSCGVSYAGSRDISFGGSSVEAAAGADALSRAWSSRGSAIKKQLSMLQKQHSLSVELPGSPLDTEGHHKEASMHQLRSPAAAGAVPVLSGPRLRSHTSLRSLSARLSPVLSPSCKQQQQRQASDDGADSSCDAAVNEGVDLEDGAAKAAGMRASEAAVAAAWEDAGLGERRSSRHSTLGAAAAAAAAAAADASDSDDSSAGGGAAGRAYGNENRQLRAHSSRRSSPSLSPKAAPATAAHGAKAETASSPRPSHFPGSPDLRSWGTTDAANTPSSAGALAEAAAAAARPSGLSSSRISWTQQQQQQQQQHQQQHQQQQKSPRSSFQLPATVAGAVQGSTLPGFSSPLQTSRSKSASWFDHSAANSHSASPRGNAASLAGPAASAVVSRQPSRALSRQQSLSLTAAAVAAAGAAATAAAAGVPVEVQLSFLGLARAQRLRRRWLLVKAWSRWQQLLQDHAAFERKLAAAANHCRRRHKRRAMLAWAQYSQYQQQKQQYPDGIDAAAQAHIAQQHLRLKQKMQVFRILQAWRLLTCRAAAGRQVAEGLAQQNQQKLLQQVLQALQRHKLNSIHKKQQLQKALRFHASWQARSSWVGWRAAVLAARAGAAQKVQHSQQLLNRVVLHWQHLSAAAVAAAVRDRALCSLRTRVQLAMLRRALTTWRFAVLQSSREQQQAALQQAQQQLQGAQQELQGELQEVQGLAGLREQLLQLQQQLEGALASKAELEQVVSQQQQELQQQEDSYQQQLSQLTAERHAAATVMQEQLDQAATTADEASHALQQLQLQHAHQQLEQQLKLQQLEHQLQQQQQQQQQLLDKDKDLKQQLAASKSQCKELAGQLKRCSQKLNQQTEAVQSLKASLDTAQEQLAAAKSASRDQNLNLTQQAFAAEKERFRSQQLLHSEQAAGLKLQQQVRVLEQQLAEQKAAAAAAADAAAKQQQLEVARLCEQLALKDQAIEQLQGSMAAVQGQLADQQAKVLAEVAQLRSGWSQAKAIIKQQRRTIKHQELQLQLAINGVLPSACMSAIQPQQQQQQQLGDAASSGVGALGDGKRSTVGGGLGPNSSQYPITSYVLQFQQPQHASAPASGQPARSSVAGVIQGSVGLACGNRSLAGDCVAGATAKAQIDQQHGMQQASAAVAAAAGGSVGADGSHKQYHHHQQQRQQQQGCQQDGIVRQEGVMQAAELLQCTNEILSSLRGKQGCA